MNNTTGSPGMGNPWGDVSPRDLAIECTTFVVLSICILFGNSMVCIAFAKDRKLKTTTNCFVVSLACSDIIVGAVVIPLYMYNKIGKMLMILMVNTQRE